MRGWVIAVLILFFIVPSAVPQCNYQLQYSGPYRASYLDIAIDGNDLWAATGYGLQLFDRTVDPPRMIDAIALPGHTRVVRASGGIAWAGSKTSIYVVRKAGRSLQLIRGVDAGGTVNDLAPLSGSLFAATTNGIASFSLADPLQPQGGLTQAPTSVRNVLSISGTGSELYAADSDGTVEVFTRSGQTLTTKYQLPGLSRSMSVRVVGSNVYVSDGQRTAVFPVGSTTKLAEFSFGASSVIDAGGNLIFAAGTDRQLHALDITVLDQPIVVFETEVVPSSGTINRITAVAHAGHHLFIAGGDTGLLSFDVSSFASPYPLRSYGFGAKSSITSSPSAVFTGDAGGGISQLNRSASGTMTLHRRWSNEPSAVHDNAGDFLLTSSGTTLRYWTLSPATPEILSSLTLRSGVRSAVLIGTTAFALLEERTLWSVDLTQQSPTPVRISTPGGPLSFLSRSTRGMSVAEITESGDTNVLYFGDVHTDVPPVSATVPGAATAMAMDDRRVAVFTFRGINIVDFGQSPPAVTVLPQSNTGLVSDMSIGGNRLADLTGENVRVWNLATATVVRQFTLPTAGTALDLAPDSDLVAVATPTGVVSLNLRTPSTQPALVATIAGNEYYRKAAASSRFLYLFDGLSADIFETTSAAPHLVASISPPGLIDIAASESLLFTLSNSGAIGVYADDGTLLRNTNLNEGADVVPISVAAVRGAVWVSFSKGCLSTGCEKKTIVYDAQSLVPTATLQGAIVDVNVAGNRAYALFDQPKELRLYNVADPLHPSPIASRVSEGDSASIAVSNGVVYALGDKLYAYSEPTLSKIGEQFQIQTPTSATRLLIDSGCAVITGRETAAQGYSPTAGAWTLLRTFDLPGTVRSIVMQKGRIVILTDYSVEVWSVSPTAKPPRRRATQ